jgi:hypothetical protein
MKTVRTSKSHNNLSLKNVKPFQEILHLSLSKKALGYDQNINDYYLIIWKFKFF